jgi:hypothetical protein
MAEPRTWTPADDEIVRSALAGLRRDVDAVPLAEPAFIRGRGDARRRQRWLGWGAAAAAAVVLAAAVGYATLGRDQGAPVPPATPPPTASALSPLAQADALPLAVEWGTELGVSSGMQRSLIDRFEQVECGVANPGTVVEAQEVRSEFSPLVGVQVRFGAGPGQAEAAARRFADALASCGAPFTVAPKGTSGWPRVFSYATGHTGSGWLAIAASGSDVTYLQVVDPGATRPPVSEGSFRSLAEIAQRRLERYGSTATATGPGTSSSEPPSSGVAIDEKMPVAGPKPLLDSSLFVAGSQWASLPLTGDKQSSAGAGEWEGTASLTECDGDTSPTGRFGIIRVRDSSTGAYFGAQRVRILGSAQAASDYSAKLLTTLGRDCEFPNGASKVTAGRLAGTYRVDTTFADGSTTLTSFIGFTAMETAKAVTTVLVWGLDDPAQGFDELARLLALARQK